MMSKKIRPLGTIGTLHYQVFWSFVVGVVVHENVGFLLDNVTLTFFFTLSYFLVGKGGLV